MWDNVYTDKQIFGQYQRDQFTPRLRKVSWRLHQNQLGMESEKRVL